MPEGTEGEQAVRVLPACLARPLRGQERTEGRGMEGMRPLRGQERTEGRGMEGTSLLMEDGLVMSLSLGDLAWLPLPPNLGPPSACPGRELSWGTSPRGPACTRASPRPKEKPRQRQRAKWPEGQAEEANGHAGGHVRLTQRSAVWNSLSFLELSAVWHVLPQRLLLLAPLEDLEPPTRRPEAPPPPGHVSKDSQPEKTSLQGQPRNLVTSTRGAASFSFRTSPGLISILYALKGLPSHLAP